MDEKNEAIEAAKQELALLQAEINTLKARKSTVECLRETFSQGPPVKILKRKVRRKTVEVTVLETDFQRLTEQARSADWVERKLSELKYLGDRLWHQLNQKTVLQEAVRRAETAEIRCRALEKEIEQRTPPPIQTYDLEEGAEREIDYPDFNDRER